MNVYLQILMSVTIIMEVVKTDVVTPMGLTTATATLDINYFLIGINVQVIIELVVCNTCINM